MKISTNHRWTPKCGSDGLNRGRSHAGFVLTNVQMFVSGEIVCCTGAQLKPFIFCGVLSGKGAD